MAVLFFLVLFATLKVWPDTSRARTLCVRAMSDTHN
jgi:hypothetical protein